jgi:hypothetical protein
MIKGLAITPPSWAYQYWSVVEKNGKRLPEKMISSPLPVKSK